MNTPVLELENINFFYNGEPALEGISLSIEKGDYTGIVGPNGGGKTTLLKIILGLLQPTSGEVRLYGKSVAAFKQWTRLGYLPQKMSQPDIRFPITVREIVSQGRIARCGFLHKFSADDYQAIEKAMQMSDISHLSRRSLSDLSGGERQRVFIARALASEPEILFLDEPVAGIDVASQSRFYHFLRELNVKYGMTILLVSHDIDILVHEASRLICVNRRLICDGVANTVFKQSLLEKLYGDHVEHGQAVR